MTMALKNLEDFYAIVTTPEDKLAVLDMFVRPLGLWLDKVKVVGDPEAERELRKAISVYASFADWTLLMPPFGGVRPIVAIYRRMLGLVN